MSRQAANPVRGGASGADDLFLAALYSVVLPGGRRLHMDELRCLAGDLGLTSARTVGSTGNLLFASRGRAVAELEQKLERAFEQRFAKPVPIFVRPAASLLELASLDPFRGAHDPRCISVRLMRTPCSDALAAALLPHVVDEQLAIVAGDLWIGFPSGPTGSKLPSALSRKETSVGGTFRSLSMIQRICDSSRALDPAASRP